MATELKDVIRLQAATESSITGDAPPPTKLKQQIHALDTGNFWYKNSLGILVKFISAPNYASQAGDGRGSVLIGDSGVTGVTPPGGSMGAPGTVHDLLVGLKNYADGIIGGVALSKLFPTWDEATSYSQNEPVFFSGVTFGNCLAVSNVAGEGTNTGNDPNTADLVTEFWTIYPGHLDGNDVFPLAEVITMILNTKANA